MVDYDYFVPLQPWREREAAADGWHGCCCRCLCRCCCCRRCIRMACRRTWQRNARNASIIPTIPISTPPLSRWAIACCASSPSFLLLSPPPSVLVWWSFPGRHAWEFPCRRQCPSLSSAGAAGHPLLDDCRAFFIVPVCSRAPAALLCGRTSCMASLVVWNEKVGAV